MGKQKPKTKDKKPKGSKPPIEVIKRPTGMSKVMFKTLAPIFAYEKRKRIRDEENK
jgi:hypothetical protein